MRTEINILIIFALLGCTRKAEVLNGHYVAVNDLIGDGYATIDVQDSVVLLNKSSVFYDERDTIIINTKRNTFVRSNRRPFPIYDFSADHDTIYVSYAYDAGEETIKFIPMEISPMFSYFAESNIDIQLRPYDNEIITSVQQNKVVNLIIGRAKEGIKWPEPHRDKILIEFERFDYVEDDELPELIRQIQEENDRVLCLHFDKRVPLDVATDIRSRIKNTAITCDIVESRINETELVYIK